MGLVELLLLLVVTECTVAALTCNSQLTAVPSNNATFNVSVPLNSTVCVDLIYSQGVPSRRLELNVGAASVYFTPSYNTTAVYNLSLLEVSQASTHTAEFYCNLYSAHLFIVPGLSDTNDYEALYQTMNLYSLHVERVLNISISSTVSYGVSAVNYSYSLGQHLTYACLGEQACIMLPYGIDYMSACDKADADYANPYWLQYPTYSSYRICYAGFANYWGSNVDCSTLRRLTSVGIPSAQPGSPTLAQTQILSGGGLTINVGTIDVVLSYPQSVVTTLDGELCTILEAYSIINPSSRHIDVIANVSNSSLLTCTFRLPNDSLLTLPCVYGLCRLLTNFTAYSDGAYCSSNCIAPQISYEGWLSAYLSLETYIAEALARVTTATPSTPSPTTVQPTTPSPTTVAPTTYVRSGAIVITSYPVSPTASASSLTTFAPPTGVVTVVTLPVSPNSTSGSSTSSVINNIISSTNNLYTPFIAVSFILTVLVIGLVLALCFYIYKSRVAARTHEEILRDVLDEETGAQSTEHRQERSDNEVKPAEDCKVGIIEVDDHEDEESRGPGSGEGRPEMGVDVVLDADGAPSTSPCVVQPIVALVQTSSHTAHEDNRATSSGKAKEVVLSADAVGRISESFDVSLHTSVEMTSTGSSTHNA